MNGKGIKYVDAWQDVGRSIGPVETFYSICKNIIPWKFCRTDVLGIRVNIGNDQENRHTHHQVKNQLIIFMFILIEKNKICDIMSAVEGNYIK